jgi:uncharacterized protein (TIRG00374 family)
LKKALSNFLKIGLSLGLGLFLVWWYYQSLTEQDKVDILAAFREADYSWILLSLVFAVLSHLSRAWRWKYTLQPLGLFPKFWNSFFAVMVGYLVNLAVPRLGEVSRCGVMNRNEGMPFQKLLGTVIAERIADFIILMSLTATAFVVQFDVVGDFILGLVSGMVEKISLFWTILIGVVLLGGGLGFFFLIFRSNVNNPIILKIREFVRGLLDGVISITRMEKMWAFIGHTIFIWLMYLAMFWICFLALPATAQVPWGGVITAFVLGGFTIIFIQGGIGAYPLAIQAVLLLYGVDANTGGAFGWIVWTAQTAMLLGLGSLSFLAMPIYNNYLKKLDVVQG